MQGLVSFIWLWTRFGFRHLRMRPWRTMAVLFGIGLGAAVFTSVRLATNASADSFARSMSAVTGAAEWSVVCPGGRVSDGLLPVLLNHRAVKAASPLLTAYVRPALPPFEPFLLIGVDPILDRSFRSWRADRSTSAGSASAWADLIGRPSTMIVGEKLALKYGLSPGERVEIESVGRTDTIEVLGVLAPQGLAVVEGGETAVTDVSTFQELTGLLGSVDRIDLILRPNTTPEELEDIRKALPGGVFLERPGDAVEAGSLMIRSYRLNLSVLSFVSLFVGMFLVYSLISLHVTSRRHELAVIRSLGGSPRLLFLLYLAEGSFFGLAGWVIAIPLSRFLVAHLLGHTSSTISLLFVRVQVDRLSLSPWEFALSFVVTLFVSILATILPALESMRVDPREALSMREAYDSRRSSYGRPAIAGVFFTILSVPVSRLPVIHGVPLWGYIAVFLLFCGFSLLSPWLLRTAGTRLPRLLRRIAGHPAYLGALYVKDAGIRAAVPVGALITATALVVSLSIMIHSFRNTVDAWVHRSLTGDLYVRPRMAEINRYRDPLPEETVGRLKALGESVDLLAYRRVLLTRDGYPYIFEPIEVEVFARHAGFLLMDGDEKEVLPELAAGRGVIVSEVFSNRTGLVPGTRFRESIQGVDLDLPILGVFRDYRTRGGVVHYSLKRFMELSGDPGWNGVSVFFKSAEGPREAARRLRAELLSDFGANTRALEITSGEDLRSAILRIFDETFAVTTVLLLIALLVAALGIATTLTVLVLERTRQIHTLIATGAGAGQVRAMIFWEAVLMAAAGELLGTTCGFILSYLLIFVINKQSFGWTFIYGFNGYSLAFSLALIFAAALLASFPAVKITLSRSSAFVLKER